MSRHPSAPAGDTAAPPSTRAARPPMIRPYFTFAFMYLLSSCYVKAGQGVCVAIFDCKAERLTRAKETLGASCLVYAVDVTDEAGVHQAVREILATKGRIDILVNAAGVVGTTNIRSHEVNLADFDRVL